MRLSSFAVTSAVVACLVALPTVAIAGPGGWGGGWGGSGWDRGYGRGYDGSLLDSRARSSRDPREGRVQVSRFIVQDTSADLLGHGPVAVTSFAPQATAPNRAFDDGPDGAHDEVAQNARAPFEAAVVDRLVAVGYDTIHADPTGGQVAEVRVSRDMLVPPEGKRKPVSGTAAMEVGTRGSAYGLGVAVDMSKPRRALISTRLDARIKDRASGKILWEGHSQIATRDGDDKWNDGAIASRLAQALFDDFRKPAG
jgi:hypothetical protein